MTTMEPIRSGVRLRVLEGGFHSELHRLERALVSLGRSTPDTVSSASYITFPEPTVSRLHAVLTWESGAKAYLLHHRSQTNPTVLNNAVISGPSLLKAGDRITLGRLVLLVEADTEPVAPAPAPMTLPLNAAAAAAALAAPPARQAELSLNAKIDGGERVFSAPIKEPVISLLFANDRATAVVSPGQTTAGRQEIRLPGGVSSGLRFEIDPATGTCLVEASANDQAPSFRLSHGRLGYSELRVPLAADQSLPFVETDVILHQGYRIWLGDPERPPDAGATLSQKPGAGDAAAAARRLTLTFLNGPWKDATISVPSDHAANLRIGPGDIGFRYPFPLANGPQCEIAVQNGQARLRAVDVPDDQFLEVDADLVFAGESVPLMGGSRLQVGDAEFLWTDGNEAVYGPYRLVDGQSSYPVRKTSVRLGTAAHCEIMLPGRELPPVIGRISFETGQPVYHHTDLSASIRVDGEDTSVGLSVPLHPGSQLELKPGFVLSLEYTPPKR